VRALRRLLTAAITLNAEGVHHSVIWVSSVAEWTPTSCGPNGGVPGSYAARRELDDTSVCVSRTSRSWVARSVENKTKEAAQHVTNAPSDWIPEDFVHRHVEVDDQSYSVVVGGDGPTLVLLHGWPQTSRAWRLVMPLIADSRTVVAPDLLGTGNSDIPARGYSKVEQAKSLSGLLESLNLHRRGGGGGGGGGGAGAGRGGGGRGRRRGTPHRRDDRSSLGG
jgi:hypothetical protein